MAEFPRVPIPPVVLPPPRPVVPVPKDLGKFVRWSHVRVGQRYYFAGMYIPFRQGFDRIYKVVVNNIVTQPYRRGSGIYGDTGTEYIITQTQEDTGAQTTKHLYESDNRSKPNHSGEYYIINLEKEAAIKKNIRNRQTMIARSLDSLPLLPKEEIVKYGLKKNGGTRTRRHKRRQTRRHRRRSHK
jgi:hypothetical protein